MKILITGLPGIGKTTLCKRLYERLKTKYKVGGIISVEMRKGSVREGFKMINLENGEELLLAKKGLKSKYRIGSYGVLVENVDKISDVIKKSVETNDITIIDEIGPMELLSEKFSKTIMDVFTLDKNIIATIHYKSNHPVIRRIKNRKDCVIYTLNKGNRERIFFEILEKFNIS